MEEIRSFALEEKKEVIGISHAEPDRCHLREEGKDITPKGNPDIG